MMTEGENKRVKRTQSLAARVADVLLPRWHDL